jgi:glucose-1-phosphate cytidylyltransferase
MGSGETTIHDGRLPNWKVHLVDTGLRTATGGRVKRLADWIGGETFMLTYGDGVAKIDIGQVVEFHRAHGKLATVTAVRPPARFGGLVFDGHQVKEFTEKPQTGAGWINGGFFVLEPGIMDYIAGDDVTWERQPLEGLAADGELMAFKHEDYWQPMDTLREKHYLQDLWESGDAPWKVWK